MKLFNHAIRLAAMIAAGTIGLHATDVQIGNVGTPSNPTGLTGNQVWTADNVYHLNGYIYVLSGATLTIEPGTVIKGKDGVIGAFGSLYICRGAKIFAQGTVEKPIVFTAEVDDLNNNLGIGDSALWGGVVLFGNAVLNKAVDATGDAQSPKYDVYEGLSDTVISGNNVHRFGGNNDADNSGVMRYCTIRHGGKALSANKEINGLSLGAVGSGTVIEYIEVLASADDGYEFFGGTVNTKYLISAFNEDDSFDTDQNFRGINQFWFSIQKASSVGTQRDKGFELNGFPETLIPLTPPPSSQFTLFNATVLGAGKNAGGAANNVFNIRGAASPKIYNCIFADFANGGLQINANSDAFVTTPNGDLVVDNSMWWDIGAVANEAGLNLGNAGEMFDSPVTVPQFQNEFINPQFFGVSRTAGSLGLDPRPQAPTVTANTKTIPNNGYLDTTANYKGAFSVDDYWADGWTTLARRGVLKVNKIYSSVTYNKVTDQATIRWSSAVGATYQVQSSTDMTAWTTVATVPGTGNELNQAVVVGGAKKFLRVVN